VSGVARVDPTSQSAYICNFREHWFTIRKFASQQWFNLNSVNNGPELISPTYLHLFLSQLQNDGYSIFIVDGSLPQCPADEALLLQPTMQPAGASGASQAGEDPELAAALALSLGQPIAKNSTNRRGSTPDAQTMSVLEQSARDLDDEDQSLKDAIARSMADRDEEDLKKALLLSMENGTDSEPSTSSKGSAVSLTNAKQQPAPVAETPNLVDLRARRTAFLDRLQNNQQPDSNEKEDQK